ncbi:TPA: c-type cytochrome [Pseudomonas aeruginosa]|jgi:cytochrome c|uniref:Cytochrome C n=1 Tax=Pseudomonas brassicacearum TaxID=930166 RepID=A0A423JWR4_9PSED|nr:MULTISPECIES: c-type cytochrome [Pseudomonas]MBG5793046.1 c-type cytochrome [Pseudomonas aeruginosa]MBG6380594.1 c-type cytochrome [Pseudomonas aeruginosa]MBH4511186.1 c-type cytochrome [Pseudomonas aeruginosa]MCO2605831.1 c-type cytochrome [Pseudomonas aeruginosa]MCS9148937.1 c-type cytochrome [Pseudomonas aeruginosa]
MNGRYAFQLFAALGLQGLINLPAQAAEACDPAAGQKLFETRCTTCHSLAEHKVGPKLGDVFGRKAGSAPGFTYTPTLEQAGFTWNTEKLDAFLSGPMTFLPGTAMAFGGLRQAEDRQALTCFLSQQGPHS